MKSKDQKRKEALERLKASSFEGSKANRLKTKTKEVWEEEKQAKMEQHR